MEAHPQLAQFIAPYDADMQALLLALRAFITDLVPEANELIWDNYNAVAIAYSKSEQLRDAFCHIAIYAKHVNFGFNRGTALSKTKVTLSGKGKLIRHIKVKCFEEFPIDEVKKMVFEAIGISEQKNPELIGSNPNAKSIVMSISDKKIRPTGNIGRAL